jgi:glucose/arabinose dehydrogenase/plastocyanin
MTHIKSCAVVIAAMTAPVLAGTHTVNVQNFAFDPADITVAPGDTVEWTWIEGSHTVTSGEPCTFDGVFFDHPINSSNTMFSWEVPGELAGETLAYFCMPHCGFGMVGSIEVSAPGAMLEFQVTIDGQQVVPPIDTGATGTGTVTLDTGTNELSWQISYSDLEGNITAAHFHATAAYCEESGVEVTLSTDNPIVGSTTLTDQQVEDLINGLWYVQIHTDLHPPGEIRGQVLPVPLDDPIKQTIQMGDVHLQLREVASGLTAPNWGTSPPGIDGRLVVTDQDGILWNVNLDTGTTSVFLDVSSRLVDLGIFGEGTFDERGLLGVAFHPDYASNGLLYTYTSQPTDGDPDFTTMPMGVPPNHQSVITEWQVFDPSDPDTTVDPTSDRELLRIDEPQFNHDGGAVTFGPDSMLYISLGDGGDGDDENGGMDPFGQEVFGHGCGGNGQNNNSILGSVLRIDPLGNDSANGQYGIPGDNPFVGVDGIDEIYAYGFRNPFRISFDSMTGELYVADVGQNDIEELNIVEAGGNYGWNWKEGSFYFVRNGLTAGYVTDRAFQVPMGLIDPIAEYDHDDGVAVVGGFVYRGTKIVPLQGVYVFGEFALSFSNDGRLFYYDANGGLAGDSAILEFPLVEQEALGLSLLGFGQDSNGEIYALANGTGVPFEKTGVVLKIATRPGDFNANGVVNVFDLLQLLDAWGPCPGCPEDINGDGVVNVFDLLILLENWGP